MANRYVFTPFRPCWLILASAVNDLHVDRAGLGRRGAANDAPGGAEVGGTPGYLVLRSPPRGQRRRLGTSRPA